MAETKIAGSGGGSTPTDSSSAGVASGSTASPEKESGGLLLEASAEYGSQPSTAWVDDHFGLHSSPTLPGLNDPISFDRRGKQFAMDFHLGFRFPGESSLYGIAGMGYLQGALQSAVPSDLDASYEAMAFRIGLGGEFVFHPRIGLALEALYSAPLSPTAESTIGEYVASDGTTSYGGTDGEPGSVLPDVPEELKFRLNPSFTVLPNGPVRLSLGPVVEAQIPVGAPLGDWRRGSSLAALFRVKASYGKYGPSGEDRAAAEKRSSELQGLLTQRDRDLAAAKKELQRACQETAGKTDAAACADTRTPTQLADAIINAFGKATQELAHLQEAARKAGKPVAIDLTLIDLLRQAAPKVLRGAYAGVAGVDVEAAFPVETLSEADGQGGTASREVLKNDPFKAVRATLLAGTQPSAAEVEKALSDFLAILMAPASSVSGDANAVLKKVVRIATETVTNTASEQIGFNYASDRPSPAQIKEIARFMNAPGRLGRILDEGQDVADIILDLTPGFADILSGVNERLVRYRSGSRNLSRTDKIASPEFVRNLVSVVKLIRTANTYVKNGQPNFAVFAATDPIGRASYNAALAHDRARFVSEGILAPVKVANSQLKAVPVYLGENPLTGSVKAQDGAQAAGVASVSAKTGLDDLSREVGAVAITPEQMEFYRKAQQAVADKLGAVLRVNVQENGDRAYNPQDLVASAIFWSHFRGMSADEAQASVYPKVTQAFGDPSHDAWNPTGSAAYQATPATVTEQGGRVETQYPALAKAIADIHRDLETSGLGASSTRRRVSTTEADPQTLEKLGEGLEDLLQEPSKKEEIVNALFDAVSPEFEKPKPANEKGWGEVIDRAYKAAEKDIPAAKSGRESALSTQVKKNLRAALEYEFSKRSEAGKQGAALPAILQGIPALNLSDKADDVAQTALQAWFMNSFLPGVEVTWNGSPTPALVLLKALAEAGKGVTLRISNKGSELDVAVAKHEPSLLEPQERKALQDALDGVLDHSFTPENLTALALKNDYFPIVLEFASNADAIQRARAAEKPEPVPAVSDPEGLEVWLKDKIGKAIVAGPGTDYDYSGFNKETFVRSLASEAKTKIQFESSNFASADANRLATSLVDEEIASHTLQPSARGQAIQDVTGVLAAYLKSAKAGQFTQVTPADQDGDGVLGATDMCPEKPEDKDNFQDEDGCPDLDNDGDNILDSVDKCPTQAEVTNGFDDVDGCPDTPPKLGSAGERLKNLTSSATEKFQMAIALCQLLRGVEVDHRTRQATGKPLIPYDAAKSAFTLTFDKDAEGKWAIAASDLARFSARQIALLKVNLGDFAALPESARALFPVTVTLPKISAGDAKYMDNLLAVMGSMGRMGSGALYDEVTAETTDPVVLAADLSRSLVAARKTDQAATNSYLVWKVLGDTTATQKYALELRSGVVSALGEETNSAALAKESNLAVAITNDFGSGSGSLVLPTWNEVATILAVYLVHAAQVKGSTPASIRAGMGAFVKYDLLAKAGREGGLQAFCEEKLPAWLNRLDAKRFPLPVVQQAPPPFVESQPPRVAGPVPDIRTPGNDSAVENYFARRYEDKILERQKESSSPLKGLDANAVGRALAKSTVAELKKVQDKIEKADGGVNGITLKPSIVDGLQGLSLTGPQKTSIGITVMGIVGDYLKALKTAPAGSGAPAEVPASGVLSPADAGKRQALIEALAPQVEKGLLYFQEDQGVFTFRDVNALAKDLAARAVDARIKEPKVSPEDLATQVYRDLTKDGSDTFLTANTPGQAIGSSVGRLSTVIEPLLKATPTALDARAAQMDWTAVFSQGVRDAVDHPGVVAQEERDPIQGMSAAEKKSVGELTAELSARLKQFMIRYQDDFPAGELRVQLTWEPSDLYTFVSIEVLDAQGLSIPQSGMRTALETSLNSALRVGKEKKSVGDFLPKGSGPVNFSINTHKSLKVPLAGVPNVKDEVGNTLAKTWERHPTCRALAGKNASLVVTIGKDGKVSAVKNATAARPDGAVNLTDAQLNALRGELAWVTFEGVEAGDVPLRWVEFKAGSVSIRRESAAEAGEARNKALAAKPADEQAIAMLTRKWSPYYEKLSAQLAGQQGSFQVHVLRGSKGEVRIRTSDIGGIFTGVASDFPTKLTALDFSMYKKRLREDPDIQEIVITVTAKSEVLTPVPEEKRAGAARSPGESPPALRSH